jgi:hypothetical protein
MSRIPLPTQSYELNSLPESAQELVNLYVEPGPPHGRAEAFIKSTPGLVELFNLQPGSDLPP